MQLTKLRTLGGMEAVVVHSVRTGSINVTTDLIRGVAVALIGGQEVDLIKEEPAEPLIREVQAALIKGGQVVLIRGATLRLIRGRTADLIRDLQVISTRERGASIKDKLLEWLLTRGQL